MLYDLTRYGLPGVTYGGEKPDPLLLYRPSYTCQRRGVGGGGGGISSRDDVKWQGVDHVVFTEHSHAPTASAAANERGTYSSRQPRPVVVFH